MSLFSALALVQGGLDGKSLCFRGDSSCVDHIEGFDGLRRVGRVSREIEDLQLLIAVRLLAASDYSDKPEAGLASAE